ncbi:hypothetical protein V6N13_051649 [Hibiscus sabdariffa]
MQDDHELGPGIDLVFANSLISISSGRHFIKGDAYSCLSMHTKDIQHKKNFSSLKIHHHRNYYRCTSAGGLVHDHDMPVPKKRHGPSALIAVAAPVNNLQLTVAYGVQKQAIPSGQWV